MTPEYKNKAQIEEILRLLNKVNNLVREHVVDVKSKHDSWLLVGESGRLIEQLKQITGEFNG